MILRFKTVSLNKLGAYATKILKVLVDRSSLTKSVNVIDCNNDSCKFKTVMCPNSIDIK